MKATLLKNPTSLRFALLFIAALGITSCSKDDDDPVAAPALSSVPTKIVMDGGSYDHRVFDLTYDSQKRIETLAISGDETATIHFNYNADSQVSQIDVVSSDSNTITFGYDSSKRLNLVSDSSGVYPFAFTATTQIYTGAGVTFSLEDNNDLKTFNNSVVSYDTSKRGPFADLGSSYHFLTIFDDFFAYAGSKKAVTQLTDGADSIVYANTFDSSGNLTALVATDPNDANNVVSLTFDYSKI